MPTELTTALLLEEAASEGALAQALHISVTGGVPLIEALTQSGAVTPEVLVRYLARSDAPYLRHVAPVTELVDRLPPGLCARLLALPVRRDPITGSVDVVVADPGDPHPASEISFHLGAPVRLLRAAPASIDDALRRFGLRAFAPGFTSTRTLPPPEKWAPSAPPPPVVLDADGPRSSSGSDIPIPLVRRTPQSGDTERPPPVSVHTSPGLGPKSPLPSPLTVSAVPDPPPLPATGTFAAYAPQAPLEDGGGILEALRVATSRDEVLELLLTGARSVARRVALFVAKRGGYLGWACTPELGDHAALHALLVPGAAPCVFERAVREGLYLGPIPLDEVHAPLLHVMVRASRDVAIVPVRVSGKTAVILLADDLGDTMLGTRDLDELARVAGESFARIVRMRR